MYGRGRRRPCGAEWKRSGTDEDMISGSLRVSEARAESRTGGCVKLFKDKTDSAQSC